MAANPQWVQDRAQPVGFDGPLVEFDDASFDPWRVRPVRHKPEPNPRARFSTLVAQ